MLLEESVWIGARLASLPDEQLFPLLNVGSSTAHFRSVTQSHIEREIFAPLAARGGQVIHVDIKAAEGVDIVGDLTDTTFITRIRQTVRPRALIVSNLLEHVPDAAATANRLLKLLPGGGLLVVSGPHSYPYHPDPIDTRFRPALADVHALFPRTHMLEGELIVSQRWRPWGTKPTGPLAPTLYYARLAAPFYRSRSWRRRMDSAPYIVRRVSAYATILVVEPGRSELPTALGHHEPDSDVTA